MRTTRPGLQLTLDVAAVVAGIFSATLVAAYLWKESHGNGFGGLFMVIIAPVSVAGLLLLWRFWPDVRRDPNAPFSAILAASAVLCVASIPQVLELFEWGHKSPRQFGLAAVTYAFLVAIAKPVSRGIYRRSHRILRGLAFAKGNQN